MRSMRFMRDGRALMRVGVVAVAVSSTALYALAAAGQTPTTRSPVKRDLNPVLWATSPTNRHGVAVGAWVDAGLGWGEPVRGASDPGGSMSAFFWLGNVWSSRLTAGVGVGFSGFAQGETASIVPLGAFVADLYPIGAGRFRSVGVTFTLGVMAAPEPVVTGLDGRMRASVAAFWECLSPGRFGLGPTLGASWDLRTTHVPTVFTGFRSTFYVGHASK